VGKGAALPGLVSGFDGGPTADNVLTSGFC